MNPVQRNFSEVYRAHFAFVWRCLRRLRVPESDLHDAAQEVFLAVYRKLDGFEGRSQLKTWIFGIVMRVASRRRSQSHARREVVVDDAILEGYLPAFPATGDDTRALAAILDDALDRLPFEQRVVFILFELEELSGEEISELLSVPVGTVRSRLRLAREGVRRCVRRLDPQARSLRKEVGT